MSSEAHGAAEVESLTEPDRKIEKSGQAEHFKYQSEVELLKSRESGKPRGRSPQGQGRSFRPQSPRAGLETG